MVKAKNKKNKRKKKVTIIIVNELSKCKVNECWVIVNEIPVS